MNIKLTIPILWLVNISWLALAQTNQPCLVQGTIKGLNNHPVYFTFQGENGSLTDTILAVNDFFTYRAHTPTDSIINFSVSADNSIFFWYEPGNVHITGSIESPDSLQIEGTPENNVLALFRKQIEWVYPNRVESLNGKLGDNPLKRQATIDFITKHPDNQTSIYLLFMVSVFNSAEAKKYRILYQDFSPKVRTSKVGKQLGELLNKS
jgi:hypothetical protein